MDLKCHPWASYRESAGQKGRHAIDEWSPDIIIAIDDDAQRYVARHYLNRPDLKIVHAGINGDPAACGYDKANNVTGILERKQLTAVRDAIHGSNLTRTKESSGGLRLMHLGDQSSSVGDDDTFIRNFDWAPLSYSGSRLVKTFDEWQQEVLDAPQRADILLLTNYRQLIRSASDPVLVPPAEVVEWTESNSKLPLIGTNGFYVEDGGMLAIGTSGFEQGEVAAGMAARLLETAAEAKDLPQESTRQFVVFMRAKALDAHGFELPKIYESFARALDHYYEN